MSKGKVEEQICPKHKTPMAITKYAIVEEDETETTVEIPECQECNYEAQFQKNLYNVYSTGEGIEEIEDAISRKPGSSVPKPLGYSIIDKYAPGLNKVLPVPLSICKVGVMSLIGSQLSQAGFDDEQSVILPTIPWIWIAPPGSYKTPFINLLTKVLYKLQDGSEHSFKGMFDTTSGPGLISSVSHYEPGIRHNVWVIIDEVSKIKTLLANRNTSDLLETFNDFIDGKVAGKNTRKDGNQKGATVFPLFIMGGTPVFLKIISEDFWDVGLGNRLFFVHDAREESRRIGKDLKSQTSFIEDFADALKKIRKVKGKVWEDDMWDAYNDYQIALDKEIAKVSTLEASLSPVDPFPITSKVKFRHQVLVLSIIYAASRLNIDEKGLLHVGLQDFEMAKKDLEEYFQPNMLKIHSVWERYDQDMGNLRNEQKIIRAITGLTKKGTETYAITKQVRKEVIEKYGEKKEEEVIEYNGTKNPDGVWVLKSRMLQNISGKQSKRIYSDTLDSMKEQHIIKILENVHYETQGKEGQTILNSGTFVALIKQES